MKLLLSALVFICTYSLYSQVKTGETGNEKYLKAKYRASVEYPSDRDHLIRSFFNNDSLRKKKLLIGSITKETLFYINNSLIITQEKVKELDLNYRNEFDSILYKLLDSIPMNYAILPKNNVRQLLYKKSRNPEKRKYETPLLRPKKYRNPILSQLNQEYHCDYLLLFIPIQCKDVMYGGLAWPQGHGLYRFPELYFVYAGHRLYVIDLNHEDLKRLGEKSQFSIDNSFLPFKKKPEAFDQEDIDQLKHELNRRTLNNIQRSLEFIGLTN